MTGTADYYSSGTLVRAFRWSSANGFFALDGDGGVGTAINASGAVAGYFKNSSGVWRPSRWNAGSTTQNDLGSLVAGDLGTHADYAFGINKDSYVVGKAITSSGVYHAFRTDAGLTIQTDLGTLAQDDTKSSIAYSINDVRQIVGASQNSAGTWHAFLKSPDSLKDQGFTDLGTLSGVSYAYSVNSSGQVVGTSNGKGFIWELGLGIKDLNTLRPSGSTFSISSAEWINDYGSIVGYGYPGGTQALHAFLLTPAP